MPSFRINVMGTDRFRTLAERLSEAAAVTLARELSTDLSETTQSLPRDARQSAISILPHSGGLNTWLMARTEISQSIEFSAKAVVVRVTASSPHDISRIDRGTVRHPLFGDRRYWYTQQVTPGWWSRPMTEAEPKVRGAIERAMSATVRRIEGR